MLKRNYTYNIGDIEYSDGGIRLTCKATGTTSTEDLVIPSNVSEVTDGTVTWSLKSINHSSGGSSNQLGTCELLFACKDASYDAYSTGSRVVTVYNKSAKFDEYFSTTDNRNFIAKKNCVIYAVAKVRQMQTHSDVPTSFVYVGGSGVVSATSAGTVGSVASNFGRVELRVGSTVSFGYNTDHGWHYGSWAVLLNYDYEQDRQELTQELNDVKDV